MSRIEFYYYSQNVYLPFPIKAIAMHTHLPMVLFTFSHGLMLCTMFCCFSSYHYYSCIGRSFKIGWSIVRNARASEAATCWAFMVCITVIIFPHGDIMTIITISTVKKKNLRCLTEDSSPLWLLQKRFRVDSHYLVSLRLHSMSTFLASVCVQFSTVQACNPISSCWPDCHNISTLCKWRIAMP